jgi:periplasmic protein TonB
MDYDFGMAPRSSRFAIPGFWASRGVALVGLVAVHALAVAFMLLANGRRAQAETESEPIVASLLDSTQRDAPVQLRPRLEPIRPVVPVVPAPSIELPLEPAPSAITVAMAMPAASSTRSDTEGDTPIVMTGADYLRQPKIPYPPAAKKVRAQGMVYVQALVEVDGRAREVSVQRSSGFDSLDRAACDWVLAAVFKPQLRNGIARSVMVIVPVNFTLKL